ncbi:hypothetical protein DRO49_03945 [Candidatus Bathyarchaeota archaeon]|nr:MAG: hypothetical protein DRO49_03945 [Candidatus Bathyarchaeota archaeon]
MVKMEIIIRVDMKIVKVFYTREAMIEKTAPTPSAPFAVKIVDEERYEQTTSHATRYENKQLERWFNNYDDAKKYAKILLEEFKEETLKALKRQNIDESAIRVFVKSD